MSLNKFKQHSNTTISKLNFTFKFLTFLKFKFLTLQCTMEFTGYMPVCITVFKRVIMQSLSNKKCLLFQYLSTYVYFNGTMFMLWFKFFFGLKFFKPV